MQINKYIKSYPDHDSSNDHSDMVIVTKGEPIPVHRRIMEDISLTIAQTPTSRVSMTRFVPRCVQHVIESIYGRPIVISDIYDQIEVITILHFLKITVDPLILHTIKPTSDQVKLIETLIETTIGVNTRSSWYLSKYKKLDPEYYVTIKTPHKIRLGLLKRIRDPDGWFFKKDIFNKEILSSVNIMKYQIRPDLYHVALSDYNKLIIMSLDDSKIIKVFEDLLYEFTYSRDGQYFAYEQHNHIHVLSSSNYERITKLRGGHCCFTDTYMFVTDDTSCHRFRLDRFEQTGSFPHNQYSAPYISTRDTRILLNGFLRYEIYDIESLEKIYTSRHWDGLYLSLLSNDRFAASARMGINFYNHRGDYLGSIDKKTDEILEVDNILIHRYANEVCFFDLTSYQLIDTIELPDCKHENLSIVQSWKIG